MINLVATGHVQCLEYAGEGFGRLVRPRDHSRVADTANAGIPWAADNDSFLGELEGRRGFKPERYALMLKRITGLPGCLFVAAPDVVADALETRKKFEIWHWLVADTGQRVAYVLQDGQTSEDVPWSRIQAVFVGGTTDYKFSVGAERLVVEALERGLWVHMGRVNSRRRWDYARSIGVHSTDGGKWTRWRDTELPGQLRWQEDSFQPRLPALPD